MLLLHLHLILLLHHHHELGLVLWNLMSTKRLLRQLSHHHLIHLIAIDRLSDDLSWDADSLYHALVWLDLRLHQLLTIRSCLLLWLHLGLLSERIHDILLLGTSLRLAYLHRHCLRSNIDFSLVLTLLLLLNLNILHLLWLLLNSCSRCLLLRGC